jgi:spermidine synthase
LYDHESNTYAEVFGDFINLKGSDSGNRMVIVPRGAKFTALREPINRAQLNNTAEIWAAQLAPYAVPIKQLAKEIAKKAGLSPDWDPKKRVLTDQYAPANLLRN